MEEGWSGLQCGVDLIREHVNLEIDRHSPDQKITWDLVNAIHIILTAIAIDCLSGVVVK